jgi:hypothetical protein
MVAEYEPDIVHLTGIDAREFREKSGRSGVSFGGGESVRGRDGADGYLIARSGSDEPAIARPVELAAAIGRRRRCYLVGTNFFYSAARICAELVRDAADAALGFRDDVESATAEAFFADFYRALSKKEWNVLYAFAWAWHRLFALEQNRLVGGGIVLWSSRSLVEPSDAIGKVAEAAEDVLKRSDDQTELGIEKRPLTVRIRPREELNYAALHNGESIFKRFWIERKSPGIVRNVRVLVELSHGVEKYEYRRSMTVRRWVEALEATIQPALTSILSRSIDEAVRTTVYVRVSIGDEILHEDTLRTSLLPPNEWRYSRESCRWLPSFVLPKDPAVLGVLDSAYRYLHVLERVSGFDGYQSARHRPERAVHDQVRAVWSAIQDLGLGYIAPPPTYTPLSQRIRGPSEVVANRRGTCLDLALLFAACLEAIHIYPVLFLTENHAFAGFWASPDAHDLFVRVPPESTDNLPLRPMLGQSVAWQVDGSEASNSELLGYVARGDLVPVETTQLAQPRALLTDAIGRGVVLFNDKTQFETMLDLRIARKVGGITPLPIHQRVRTGPA